jgi:hypothetical protein
MWLAKATDGGAATHPLELDGEIVPVAVHGD